MERLHYQEVKGQRLHPSVIPFITRLRRDDDTEALATLFSEEGPQVALAVHNMVVGFVFDLVGGFSLVVEHAGVGGFLVEVGFEGLEDLDAAGIVGRVDAVDADFDIRDGRLAHDQTSGFELHAPLVFGGGAAHRGQGRLAAQDFFNMPRDGALAAGAVDLVGVVLAGIGVLGVVERGQSLGIGKGATLWLSSQLS